jgi:hypothetical protein
MADMTKSGDHYDAEWEVFREALTVASSYDQLAALAAAVRWAGPLPADALHRGSRSNQRPIGGRLRWR